MKLAALLLLAVVSGAAALDLRAIVMEARGEGGKYTYLEFRDRGKPVTYMPPIAWKSHGRADVLSFTVPEVVGVEIDIRTQELEVPLSVDDSHHRAFEQVARQSLPGDATKVELLGSEMNPIRIDGRATVEFTFQYVIFGSPVRVSYLYVTRGYELLCFRVVARPADFARLHRTFRQSLHSFDGL